MMRLGATATVLVILAAGVLSGGCGPSRGGASDAEQLAQARSELRDLRRENRELKDKIADQEEQIDTLLELGEGRVEELFHVQRIALGRHSGAVDLDGDDEHDAIRVYLRPIDRDGSVVKAAGSVTIQMFDLANAPNENLIARYEWTPREISKKFSGGFMGQHFTFDCPVDKRSLQRDEITIRVGFTDYLTGKTFTAQEVYKFGLFKANGEE